MSFNTEKSENHRSPVKAIYGILPISIYTKPWVCGGSCIYCPTDNKFPKSYLENEDTLQAKNVDYSAGAQFMNRLDKISDSILPNDLPFEVIVLGGSFSSLPMEYRTNFVTQLYEDMNQLSEWRPNLIDGTTAVKDAIYRCSVLTVESRPDQITPQECDFLRSLGVTKVELGVQSTSDDVLQRVNRGHLQSDIKRATTLLKDGGFKVGFHLMIGLPGSTLETDTAMLGREIWHQDYSPDYIKVYPCVLLANGERTQQELHKLFIAGDWCPPSEEYSQACLEVLAKNIPSYVRVSRIQRQFEDNEIGGGVKMGLRRRMVTKLYDVRSREIGKQTDEPLKKLAEITVHRIDRSNDQYFEATSHHGTRLYGMLRLRIRSDSEFVIRELKVFGIATPVGSLGQIQGKGVGSKLIRMAEAYVRECGKTKLQVNAGVGARSFFLKHGYCLTRDNHFLSKALL